MKKIFLLLFLSTATTTFISCNKDDDDAQTTAELLVGSWEFSQEGAILGGTEMLEPYDHEAPECGRDYVQFNDNGTGLMYYYYNDDGCDNDTDSFMYTVTGNDFTMTSYGEEETGTIMSINSSSLKVKFIEVWEGTTFEYIWVLNKK